MPQKQEAPPPCTSSRPRRLVRRGIALALGLAIAGLVAYRLTSGNFGVVDPGKVYRSAQPTSGLASLIRERKLASILNLRGGSPADPFYAREVDVTDDAGVAFYDFPISAVRRPSRSELLVLIDLFDRCAYPLLIHCKWGSDRTALASAVYLLVKGEVPDRALAEFTLRHGHVPLAGPEHLQEPLLEYRDWLATSRTRHAQGTFRDWVARHYRGPGKSPIELPALRPGPRKPRETAIRQDAATAAIAR